MALDMARAQKFGRMGGIAARPYHQARSDETRARYEACAAAGLSKHAAAMHLGVTWRAVNSAAWRYGLTFAGQKDRGWDKRGRK